VTANGKTVATGIDHLIELGVTHVHLLPTFDYGSVDELKDNDYNQAGAFNWGYDPQNYNVPEGNYATQVWNPYTRINEFKAMVNALHDAGIKVVMDVVYNHTYSTHEGPFHNAVPGYYYRTDLNTGLYSDGAGCGNEVADERKMVRKFIVDSVSYWQDEYRIDGFRFDLMGLHSNGTMEAVSKALKTKDPSVLVYGEPWGGYGWNGSIIPAPDSRVDKGTQKGREHTWAFFNDNFRIPLKGEADHNNINETSNYGFITGKRPDQSGNILYGARGSFHPDDYGTDKHIVGRAAETVK
jgi:pullulanase